MTVKLNDIIDAIEMTDQYTENYLDATTGKIEYINDMVMGQDEKDEIYERLDEHGFYRLPTSFDIREYDIMEDFIAGMPEGLQERMYDAIQGRGAFRRFKDMVYDMGIEQVWYDFQNEAYKRMAARWCEENGVDYE